jgi:hypothetical protein
MCPPQHQAFSKRKLFVENVTGRHASGMDLKSLARRQRDAETSNERMLAICDFKDAAWFLQLYALILLALAN